jgi:hypothetical protein
VVVQERVEFINIQQGKEGDDVEDLFNETELEKLNQQSKKQRQVNQIFESVTSSTSSMETSYSSSD